MREVTCDACARTVPVKPGLLNVSVPHVVNPAHQPDAVICKGNTKLVALLEYVPEAWLLAQRCAVLDDDAYWEGL